MGRFSQSLTSLLSPDRTYVKLLAYIKAGLQACGRLLRQPDALTWRKTRLMLTVKPWFTMLSVPRLFNLYDNAIAVRDVPGDIVECGVWRGGGLAMMGAACADTGVTRHFWAFDSFQGLPPPSEHDGQAEMEHYYEGLNLGNEEMVRVIWHRLGLPLASLHTVPGWFEDTLPDATVEKIAVLHVDGDWYDSVKTTLESLYDRVSPGGIIQIDDYHYWEGCQRAVDEFMDTHGLPAELLRHEAAPAVYFYKPPTESGARSSTDGVAAG